MKFFVTAASALLGLASMASAHMEMTDPAPLRSKHNKFTTDVEYSMTAPLSASGQDFPCKGFHTLMGTPQGQAVTTWTPGGEYSMTINGGANHGGGSCQASLSYDQGATWTVIHSYIGNCPPMGESSYKFTIPADTPSGEALFAWTWFNAIGNREMYMNCAVVNIEAPKKRLAIREDLAAFSARPAMFVANVGNGCEAPEGKDVELPNPGPDVTRNTAGTIPPNGSCGPAGKAPPPDGDDGEDKGKDKGEDKSQQEPAQPPAQSESPPASSTTPETVTSNLPGGVFSENEPTSSAQNQPPTTSAYVKTDPPAAPNQAPASTSSVTSVPAASGAVTPGTPCTPEGMWNCIDGKKYQRCASGQWSVLMDVYPGGTCRVGQSTEFLIARGNVIVRM